MRNGIQVNLQEGGLGRRNPSNDMVCGLVMGGISVVGNIQTGEVHVLKSVDDAVALGLDAAYDTTNNVLVHHHISRFFLRNPSGELRIMLVTQGTSLTDMCDKTNNHVKYLIEQSKNELRAIGVVLNPAVAYAPTLSGGLDEDVLNAIPKAQGLYDEQAGFHRRANILIEGRELNGTISAASDLRALTAKYKNVAVTILQDPDIADNHAIHAKYAAVGDVLGLISKAAVSQNIGEQVDDFNLTDTDSGAFVKCGLSNGSNVYDVSETDLDTLHDKGFIFGRPVIGLSGFWIDDSPTCTEIASDYAYLENNDTIHKAIKLVRTALLPRVKGRVPIEPGTGYIDPVYAKSLEQDVKDALNPMLSDGDISGGIDAFVDPNQNLLTDGQLAVQVEFIPQAIGRKIVINLGFSAS